MHGRILLATVAVALVASGCSFLGTLGAEEAVSCSYGGGSSFPQTYMDGPEMTPVAFLGTPQGQALNAFFVGGEGEVEAGPFAGADHTRSVGPSARTRPDSLAESMDARYALALAWPARTPESVIDLSGKAGTVDVPGFHDDTPS
jgi:hypothetical protein